MTDTAAMTLRRRAVLAMGALAVGCAGAAKAGVFSPADLVDVQVVDRETGQPLQAWRHEGRLFVAGQPGARYGLRVANHSEGRVLVVMSVDGVNVLTGETAGYGQRGYVFEPHETYDITGWRKSQTEVAAFTFAPLPQSYAARTGRPFDVGVIGIAAFRERVVYARPLSPLAVPAPLPQAPAAEIAEPVIIGSRAATAKPAPSDIPVAAERRVDKLGTAHGAREWSAVSEVAFERATPYPQLVRRIEYDSWDNLVALGIVRPPPRGERRPRPFPDAGYVPDPPGGL